MEPIESEDRLLTIREVSEILRVAPSTAKKWAAEGKLPGALPKIGGVWRIHEKTFREYLRRRVVPAANRDVDPRSVAQDLPETT